MRYPSSGLAPGTSQSPVAAEHVVPYPEAGWPIHDVPMEEELALEVLQQCVIANTL